MWRAADGRARAWPKWLAALVIVVLTAGTTIAVMLPATWIAPLFAQATDGRIGLANAQGSLWHGSANLMLAAGADSNHETTLLPERMTWRTRVLPLLRGRVQMVMREARPMAAPVLIDAGWHDVTIFAGALSVPASILAGLGAPFNTLDLQGDTRLDWTDWHLLARVDGTPGMRGYGSVTIEMRDVSSSVSRMRPLGSYRATIAAAGSDATLTLLTLQGPLLLSGNGQLHDGHFHFDGRASATPAARANLSGLLNLLGREIDPDTVALTVDR